MTKSFSAQAQHQLLSKAFNFYRLTTQVDLNTLFIPTQSVNSFVSCGTRDVAQSCIYYISLCSDYLRCLDIEGAVSIDKVKRV